MTPCHEQRETDFRRLKEAVVSCWGRLEQPDTALLILREATQQYVAWSLQETLGAEELLQHLERAAVLSPNSVGLLSNICEMLGCKDSIQVVKNYLNMHPPTTSGGRSRRSCGTQPRSAPAELGRGDSAQFNHKPETTRSPAEQFTSNFDPPMAEYKPSDRPFPASGELDWPSKEPSAMYPEVLVMPDSRESSCSEGVWRTMSRSELGGGGGGSMWPPLESVPYERLQTAETEEGRLRSMALWGHAASSSAAPRHPQPAPQAVCECHLPPVPPATPRRRYPKLATTVEQVLDLPPTATTTSSGSSSSRARAGPGGGIPGVTPSGARRARLVDFLSQRLGARYQQLGEELERVGSAELAAITGDTDSDLVSRSRRLLRLYLSRHRDEDGDAEQQLVRRLRRIRFNRLADELELWSAEQDQWEDPRDWPEDKVQWKEGREWPEDSRGHRRSSRQERRGHPSPVRIPRMTCC